MKSSLLQSRKFWIMTVDVVVSIVTYFVTKYFSPDAGKDVLFLIGALQPIVLLVVNSITQQNMEYIKAASQAADTKAYLAKTTPNVIIDKVQE